MDKKETMTIQYKLMLIQIELKAPKNQYNSFGKYKYRSAEDILEALKPFEEKYLCTVTTPDEIINIGNFNYVKVNATLTCAETGDFIIIAGNAKEAVTQKGMSDSQVTGSTASYAKKYALGNLFCIDDTKDSDTKKPEELIKPVVKKNLTTEHTNYDKVKSFLSDGGNIKEVEKRYILSDEIKKELNG